ncbi:MAG: hypothetical protein HYY67_04715 [Thaumarchaeota archaeon]|nr:hypothetical protein [Nitrososphaerota archaeon]
MATEALTEIPPQKWLSLLKGTTRIKEPIARAIKEAYRKGINKGYLQGKAKSQVKIREWRPGSSSWRSE